MIRHLSRAILALAACAFLTHACAAASPSPRTLTTSFTYKAGVPEIPPGAKALDFWIPIPSDGPLQTIRDLKVDAPGEYRITKEGKFGNRMVYLHMQNTFAPITVTVRFTVDRKEALVLSEGSGIGSLARGQDALNQYVQADSRVPLGGRYKTIADEVAGGKATNLEKAHALYEHVIASMQYDYVKESPKYAQGDVAFVCDYKKGNCSDLHSYLISLARNLGIPAYLEYGFPLTGIPVPNPVPAEGSVGGYHCWTWFYDKDHGWAPLDASDGRRWLDANHPEVKEHLFGNLVLERSAVAFSRGRDITLSPRQKSGPLNDFIYPYAEADGQSVKATYEVRYNFPGAGMTTAAGGGGQNLQKQIDDLRKLVMQQAQEIAQLKAKGGGVKAADKPDRSPSPVTAASRSGVGFYGFLRLDAISDGAQANNTQAPLFIQSPSNANVAGRSNGAISLHPRLTRLGYNLSAPADTLKGQAVTGKFEMDWQNGQGVTAESRPLPRIRHAYIQLQRGPQQWLLGQTWDLISPLNPSPNDDTLMWGAGNLGDRRPQIRFTHETNRFSAALALGLTGAIDAKDLDTNGIRDGKTAALRTLRGELRSRARTPRSDSGVITPGRT